MAHGARKERMSIVRVGTRASPLALKQTALVIERLKARWPEHRFLSVPISTTGDQHPQASIHALSAHGKRIPGGVFHSTLEKTLREGVVDLVVASAKDVESPYEEESVVQKAHSAAGAAALGVIPSIASPTVMEREDPRDALVSLRYASLRELPLGSVLATSSPRRCAQLRAWRSDLRCTPLRGNVDTRISRAVQHHDGMIIAVAGISRLGLHAHIRQRIPLRVLLPAPGQGALICQHLAAETFLARLLRPLCHAETEACVRAEKDLLTQLSGGCFAPVGILARVRNGRILLHCRVSALDGQHCVEIRTAGSLSAREQLVVELAQEALQRGAGAILDQVRKS